MVKQAGSERIDRKALATEFAKRMKGKLDPAKIQAAVEKIKSPSTPSYGATAGLQSYLFYVKVQVGIIDGAAFNGDAGGITEPGGGTTAGFVFTDDLDTLYSATKSFEYNAALAYTSVLFFDSDSNFLGHFEGATAASQLIGVGGGSGSWS